MPIGGALIITGVVIGVIFGLWGLSRLDANEGARYQGAAALAGVVVALAGVWTFVQL